MNRGFVALVLVAQLGCGGPTAPSGLASRYLLLSLDGKSLPVPFGQDGSMLVSGLLDFGTLVRARGPDPVSGTVRYVLEIRRPNQSIDRSDTRLNYTIQDDVVRIDLCPPGALCITTTELVGPLDSHTTELVLTHYVAGKPQSVYRFVAD
jgi:hypothetical protein